MPKKAGIVMVSLGAVLILSALLLMLYNGFENEQAGQEAELLLEDVQSAILEQMKIPALEVPKTPENTEETAEILPSELPVVEIDGYGYIGYLSIPDLELELPVMSEWDYTRLKKAPCRHFGSARTDDLVIAAHNYKRHFGRLKRLETGAEVTFTDMDGIVYRYELARIETLLPDAVEAVQNSGHALVLYTCTLGGETRIAAFFDRVAEENQP